MSVPARLRAQLRRVRRAWRMEQIALHRRRAIAPNTVVYESFAGNGALGNPEAIYRGLLASPDMAHLEHIWVLDRPDSHPQTVAKLTRHPRTRVVARHSSAYWRALSTSQYLVNNATFPTQFGKREGQIYLNTWHGTPLKRMGYDMPEGGAQSSNVVRNFLAADYLLSQSPEMTDVMYRSAFKLDGIYRGRILEAGYPRVDRQFLSPDEAASARAQLIGAGLGLGDRTLVVYAPTWRGGDFSRPENDADRLLRDVTALQSRLGEDYFVALKTHQVVHRLAASLPALASVLVPNRIPTNVVLGITDVLVTDYSSIFFDFLPTDRPLVFYTPEASSYEDGRGLYIAPADLPGPVTVDIASLAAAIVSGGAEYAERRSEWRARFTPDDDGRATERVIDAVFRGVEHPEFTRRIDGGRKQILIHLGGLRANGITSSALNLLSTFDYARADVTAIYNTPRGAENIANQRRIDPHVRQIPRTGGMNGSKLTHLVRKLSQTPSRIGWHRTRRAQRRLWDDEFTRLFGDARFDAVVDFSGYSPFWATLLLHAPGSRSAIWLHSDLAAEANRPIRGKARMRRSLTALAALYREFDRVVSVSGGLNEINRDSFAEIAGEPERFVSSRNLIDPAFLDRAHRPRELSDEEATWARRLRDDEDHFWFVTVGRFSAEKNQERMIRAFEIVARERPTARLLLIGYGPMRGHLEAVVEELRLGDRVFLVGPLLNPAPVLLHADGFVLSSDWEGQPMVLLEAAALGVPIVTVAFGSVWGALPPGQMRIVDRTVEALAEGMLALALGQVPAPRFDLAAYNAEALSEFERVTE